MEPTENVDVVFRVDASLVAGAGHVMRCLALAKALRGREITVRFVCRELPGNLNDIIQQEGFPVTRLPVEGNSSRPFGNDVREWLGVPQEVDAIDTRAVVEQANAGVLIVDHYSIDTAWEAVLASTGVKMVAIDDLANRRHVVDVLVDPGVGRRESHYQNLVPSSAAILVGGRYALLREEFAQWRESGKVSPRWSFGSVLISMGGVDASNATTKVLRALSSSKVGPATRWTVVVGKQCPHLPEIKRAAEKLDGEVKVYVDVANMAELMAAADLSIGAAGGTAWERCCLGLPALMVVLAENQREVAEGVQAAGAGTIIGDESRIESSLLPALQQYSQDSVLASASRSAWNLIDGRGVARVCEVIERMLEGR